jgi:hypothetical protein
MTSQRGTDFLRRTSREKTRDFCFAGRGKLSLARANGCVLQTLFALALLAVALPARAGAEQPSAPPLPDAPQPQSSAPAEAPKAVPCLTGQPGAQTVPCPAPAQKNWFERFLTGPEVKPMTPKEKAQLAARNLVDPFNALTIVGTSAISVGFDAHSPYGPGMKGLGRNVGVSYTQDIIGEFFGTFLIPSIVHQDPHYHRMPNASIPRRAAHAIVQVAWTRGDNGKDMVNYADLVGFAFDDEISNFYVPDQQTNLRSTVERYGIGLATAPIDNFVTEFLPDIARRIHVHVVLIQRIVNQVARTNNTETQ